MQALEELAMSYDTKDKEIDVAYNERDQIKLELESVKVSKVGMGILKVVSLLPRIVLW